MSEVRATTPGWRCPRCGGRLIAPSDMRRVRRRFRRGTAMPKLSAVGQSVEMLAHSDHGRVKVRFGLSESGKWEDVPLEVSGWCDEEV